MYNNATNKYVPTEQPKASHKYYKINHIAENSKWNSIDRAQIMKPRQIPAMPNCQQGQTRFIFLLINIGHGIKTEFIYLVWSPGLSTISKGKSLGICSTYQIKKMRSPLSVRQLISV